MILIKALSFSGENHLHYSTKMPKCRTNRTHLKILECQLKNIDSVCLEHICNTNITNIITLQIQLIKCFNICIAGAVFHCNTVKSPSAIIEQLRTTDEWGGCIL